MRWLLLTSTALLTASICRAQLYNEAAVCGTDTITVDHRELRGREPYKAFSCTQVSKLGIRFNAGVSSFSYAGATREWLGNHNAAVIGAALVHRKFGVGVNFKLATVTPQAGLLFGDDTLASNALLNPIKSDFYAGYAIRLKGNFSIEPSLGVTKNTFVVINEEEINRRFDIPVVYGLHTGVTINKYFALKNFQFLALFFSYNYGFTNFRKVAAALGTGYSEWSFGLAYKVYAKRQFYKRLG